MSFELRPYQSEAVAAALQHLQTPRPFIIVAATGAGKSLIIADICHKLDEPVLILQPSKEILEQNYAKLLSYDPIIDAGIYSASKGRKEIRKFTYATIGSIYRKPQEFSHFKYIIIDEVHLVNPKNLNGMYSTFLRAIGCKNVCGLSATPYRLDQKFFMENGQLSYTATLKMINRISRTPFFKQIVYLIETPELIRQGFLSPIRYRIAPANLDMLRVNTTGADFTEESLEKFWDDKRLKALSLTIRKIDQEHKLNLVFCASIRQAMKAKRMLDVMGISSIVVTGTTPTAEREAAIADFRAGRVRHLINVGVFTTGFDVPELDSIVLARPTMSLALYYQMVGRGVRKDPNDPSKILTVYDFAGVVERLGRVETIRIKKEPHPTIKNFMVDKVVSEAGDMTNVPLFTFQVKRADIRERFANAAVKREA